MSVYRHVDRYLDGDVRLSMSGPLYTCAVPPWIHSAGGFTQVKEACSSSTEREQGKREEEQEEGEKMRRKRNAVLLGLSIDDRHSPSPFFPLSRDRRNRFAS